MSLELLTRTEEIVLVAVYQLGGNAYGVTIRKHIEQTIQKQFSVLHVVGYGYFCLLVV